MNRSNKVNMVNIDPEDVEVLKDDPVLNQYYQNLSVNNTEEDNDMNHKEISEVHENTVDTAIIGIGQCGGNIAHKATNQGFLTCAINTSKEDLAGCNTDLKFEFHNAGGSGKERSRSKNIFASNLDTFNSFFQNRFSDIKNIIIVASAAGGTGGGSAPMCARFLKDNYPNKNIFLFVILGSIYEDIKSQENMLSVLEEINKCEVNYLVFDNNRIELNEDDNSNKVYEEIDTDVINAAKFISRQYFLESNTSNIDIVDMQKLYIENKRMMIVSGKFDDKVSNKVSLDDQIIKAIEYSGQINEINNPMSYAVFISTKPGARSSTYKFDKEFRSLVDRFGEPYEIYKHYQTGPLDAPDFVVCITGLGDCVDRYSIINERLSEFNERLNASKKLSDVNKVTINARTQSGVTLPDEVDVNNGTINKSSLDMFM